MLLSVNLACDYAVIYSRVRHGAILDCLQGAKNGSSSATDLSINPIYGVRQ